MAISFPLSDLLTAVPFQPNGYEFEMAYRQELSRRAGGPTTAKDLGSPLWRMAATTGPLTRAQALGFEAKLASMDGSLSMFMAHDLRNPLPIAHADGAFDDTATIYQLGANNKSLSLQGLPAGFTLTPGDYLSMVIDGSERLHQVMESASAAGTGRTGLFEVRPHLWPGKTTGLAIRLKQARCPMLVQPGTIKKRMVSALHTEVSFEAFQWV